MTPKTTIPCTCGHAAKQHDFTRKAPGCRVCTCIAYRTFDPTPLHRGNAEELAHWSHHVGNPPNTPQMTAEQCNAAYRRERYRNRREILAREIQQLERETAAIRNELEAYTRSVKRDFQAKHSELERKYAALAAIPDMTRASTDAEVAA